MLVGERKEVVVKKDYQDKGSCSFVRDYRWWSFLFVSFCFDMKKTTVQGKIIKG